MTRPAEPRLTKAHRAVQEYITTNHASKDAAARQAIVDGYPVDSPDDAHRFEAVRQQLRNLSNGHVHRPSLERMIWFQVNWGIAVEDWQE